MKEYFYWKHQLNIFITVFRLLKIMPAKLQNILNYYLHKANLIENDTCACGFDCEHSEHFFITLYRIWVTKLWFVKWSAIFTRSVTLELLIFSHDHMMYMKINSKRYKCKYHVLYSLLYDIISAFSRCSC